MSPIIAGAMVLAPELTVLALAALLQFVQYVLLSVPANLEARSPAHLLGRATMLDLTPDLSTRTARIARALDNHFDALILFTIAVVVVDPRRQGVRLHRRLRLGLSSPRGSSTSRPTPSASSPGARWSGASASSLRSR
jgi:hypothetical protein